MSDVTGEIGEHRRARVSFEAQGDSGKSRVFVGAPDYRVYIWGIEVSPDVVAIQVSNQVNENLNTATITIANDNEKWVVPQNLVDAGQIPDELTLVGDARADRLFTQAARGTNTRRDNFVTPIGFAKRKITNFRQAIRGNQAHQLGRHHHGDDAFSLLLKEFRNPNFPFISGRPMIQMGDPIRVFLKNPWNLGTRPQDRAAAGLSTDDAITLAKLGVTLQGEDGKIIAPENVRAATRGGETWYFGFTGYIAAVTEEFQAESNRSQLVLLCEDIRRLLRYMRTTTSPNVYNLNVVGGDLQTADPNKPGEGADESNTNRLRNFMHRVAGDDILITGNATVSAGMRLVNTTPGPDKLFDVPGNVTRGPATGLPGIVDLLFFGDQGDQLQQLGITTGGHVSSVLGFNPNDRTIALLQGSSGKEIEGALSKLLDRIYPELSESEVDEYGADWSLGAFPELAPEPNHLWIILPDSKLFAPEAAPNATTAGNNLYWPFDFKMTINYYNEFRSRLDVVNEFVQNIESVWYTTPKGDVVIQFPTYDGNPFSFDAPWLQILQLRDEFTNFSSTEDDRNLATITIAQGSPVAGLDGKDLPPIAVGRAFNPQLAARFGIRQQYDSRPFKYDEEHRETALKSLAAMWQGLRNADAFRIDGLTMTPNFRAPLAMPYHFAARNVICYAVAVHQQVAWGQVCQTAYDFRYLRHREQDDSGWEQVGGRFGWHWLNQSGDQPAQNPDQGARGTQSADTSTTETVRMTPAEPISSVDDAVTVSGISG